MQDITVLIQKHGSLFKSSLDNRIREINEEIASKTESLVKERDELISILRELTNKELAKKEQLQLDIEVDEYNKDMSTINKAAYVVKKNGWLTLNEIANQIKGRELDVDLSALKATLSAVLAMDAKKEDSKFERRRNDKNKWEYNFKK